MMIRQMIALFMLIGASGLMLSGCAPAAVGIGSAAIAAGTTEKGLSTSVGDTVIFAKLKDKFIKSDQSLVTSISSSVNNGSVLLTGRVETQEQKFLATKLAWEIKGVSEVVNEVVVSQKPSLKDRAKDVSAGAQLRAALIADKNVSSLNYSFDVVDGVIYLSGVAEDAAERDRVIAHAQKVKFAKDVVNYTILSTDKRD
jgi:osmotically-inducible protein OsmY